MKESVENKTPGLFNLRGKARMPDIDNAETAETLKKSEIIRERVFYLDFIRAISICLIIIFHFDRHASDLNISDNPIFGTDFELLGRIGVSLFIILSGASLMLNTRERFDVKKFYKKRFFSIYPLFWVAYATTFLCLFLLSRHLPPNHHPATILLTIMGLDGFLLFAIPNYYLLGEWFIGFILIFYVTFPLLRYLLLRYRLFTLLSCFFIALLITLFYDLEMSILRFPPSRLMEFALGMCFIYYFSTSHKIRNLLFFGMAVLLFSLTMTFNIPLLFEVAMQGVSVFLGLAIISVFFENASFGRIIRFLSAYSFGAFLIHHVMLIQILSFFVGQQLRPFYSYLLFSSILLVIYGLSFLLTNVNAFVLRKIGVYT